MTIHGIRYGSLFFWLLIKLYAAAVYERRVLHVSEQLMSQTTAIRHTTNEARTWNWICMLWIATVTDQAYRIKFHQMTASPGKDPGGVHQCQLDKINRPLFSLFYCPALWSRKAARRTKADGLVGNTGAATVMQRNFKLFNKVIQCLFHSSHCIYTKHQTVKTNKKV